MRGRFSPGATEEEWCERHLLARIHRYTVKRLRREIEPVERHDFMRFLFEWQHLTPDTRSEGRDALAAVLDQMEGFQAAAGAWEEDILPARVKAYANISLDELCRAGKIVWTRLTERARGATGPIRSTPIVLLPRAQVRVWRALIDPSKQPELSARAQSVHDTLSQHGAMFFDELLAEVHGLRMELENALGELVAAGLVNSDSFAGLRALLKPVAKRSAYSSSRRVRSSALIGGMDDAGRWALVSRQPVVAAPEPSPDAPPAVRPRSTRTCRHDVAAPLWRGVLAFARTRGRVAAAVAGPVARVSAARSARRHSRRAVCEWPRRRTVCFTGSDSNPARSSTACERWCFCVCRRNRSFESCRYAAGGRTRACRCRESGFVSRWNRYRDAGGGSFLV